MQIGRTQRLEIRRLSRQGAVLSDGQDEVLLAKRELPAGSELGAAVDAFVYRDGKGVLVATLARPRAELGEIAFMTVSSLADDGAFLDWGLEKELFIPAAQQTARMRVGRAYAVAVCLDNRNGRLIGSARLSRRFDASLAGLEPGQMISATILRFTGLGALVVVNRRFSGLLYKGEMLTAMQIGQTFDGYVRSLREDGKLDISLKAPGRAGRDQNAEAILKALEDATGYLPLHDKSPPEQVAKLLGMSKKAFKRAAGNLYRQGRVTLTDEGLTLKGARKSRRGDG